jgi:hypothetical protein
MSVFTKVLWGSGDSFDQKYNGSGDIPQGSGREAVVVGWGVLVGWVLI